MLHSVADHLSPVAAFDLVLALVRHDPYFRVCFMFGVNVTLHAIGIFSLGVFTIAAGVGAWRRKRFPEAPSHRLKTTANCALVIALIVAVLVVLLAVLFQPQADLVDSLQEHKAEIGI